MKSIHQTKTFKKKPLSEKAYLKILEETRGSWGPATKEELESEEQHRQLELKAVEEARKEW